MFLDYELPPELIAQEPVEPRDAARLLVIERGSGTIQHHHFRDLPTLLRAGDRLIVNDTRVLPARLFGTRAKTGGKWEGLFLHERPDGLWEMLAQTRGWVEIGESITLADGSTLVLRERTMDRHWLMQPHPAASAVEVLQRLGDMPLPPYIHKGRARPEDAERYQTVYADRPGAVAAPTAGLHFTPELLERLQAAGIDRSTVTLHVGLGTFEPMRSDDVQEHTMHHEWCDVPPSTVQAIHETRSRSGRCIAIGTTAVRSLESAAQSGRLEPFTGETNLFIHPPYSFRAVDALITNFHLPKTTLLLLVGAFTGVELLRTAYETAIRERYRFYSYGDAMLVL